MVGGKPVRTRLNRRMNVLGSVGPSGTKPASASFAKTNLSTGAEANAAASVRGTSGRTAGRRLHQSRRSFMKSFHDMVTLLVIGLSRGSAAPFLTHVSRSAIIESGSFPLGGIFRESSVYRIALISKLVSGFDPSRAGPVSPPFLTPSLLSKSSSPPNFFASAE